MRWTLVAALFLAPACGRAQVEGLEAVYSRAVQGLAPRPALHAPVMRPGRSLFGRGSAVLIGGDRALTSAHLVERPELRLALLKVGGRRASVLRVFDVLAVLKVEGASAPPLGVTTAVPEDGARLEHRWFDHKRRVMTSRPVTWRRWSSVAEGFAHGMSGSGVFTARGELAGIAERSTGQVTGPIDLAEILRILSRK